MTDSEDLLRTRTLDLVRAYQTLVVSGPWDDWIELWAEDGELDFPYAPAGRQRVYRGKDEILTYMKGTGGSVAVDTLENLRVFPMQDPEIAMVEVSIKGHNPATGAPYNQSYVLIFELNDGKLQRYREYWNPLVSIDAAGGRDAWASGFGFPDKGTGEQ